MKLYDYIKLRENGAEITVYDKEYDMEVYFYADKPDDDWNKAIEDLSKLLTITKIIKDSVEVNFSELIEFWATCMPEMLISSPPKTPATFATMLGLFLCGTRRMCSLGSIEAL